MKYSGVFKGLNIDDNSIEIGARELEARTSNGAGDGNVPDSRFYLMTTGNSCSDGFRSSVFEIKTLPFSSLLNKNLC